MFREQPTRSACVEQSFLLAAAVIVLAAVTLAPMGSVSSAEYDITVNQLRASHPLGVGGFSSYTSTGEFKNVRFGPSPSGIRGVVRAAAISVGGVPLTPARNHWPLSSRRRTGPERPPAADNSGPRPSLQTFRC
jgi:hypothetical protein